MKRSELNMLESYKRNELIDRLKPIKDWDSIKKGELIWNDNSDSIFGYDKFEGLNPTDEDIIIYRNQKDVQYTYSKTGWYHYNENIAAEVDEMWTPKLYGVTNKNNCTLYLVACNTDHAWKCFNEEYNYDVLWLDFKENYLLFEFDKCGDFDIIVK